MKRTSATESFGRTLTVQGGIDLLRSAATIGLIAYPDLDVEATLDRFEALAGDIGREIDGATDQAAAAALNEALFVRRNFRGNREHYADPRNCYIHEVLERRTGLPIALSVVYMEIGRRLGLSIEGVGFPEHFIVRVDTGNGSSVFIDPFNGGQELSRADLGAFLERIGGDPVRQLEIYLAAVTPKQILTRLLNNLKSMYINQANYAYARGSVNLILEMTPWALEEIRDRGLLSGYMGDYRQAEADLGAYLESSPAPSDAFRIRQRLLELREQHSHER